VTLHKGVLQLYKVFHKYMCSWFVKRTYIVQCSTIKKGLKSTKNPSKMSFPFEALGIGCRVATQSGNGQNKFPAGKNQGISKIIKNQGIIREFYKKWRKEMSTGSFSSWNLSN